MTTDGLTVADVCKLVDFPTTTPETLRYLQDMCCKRDGYYSTYAISKHIMARLKIQEGSDLVNKNGLTVEECCRHQVSTALSGLFNTPRMKDVVTNCVRDKMQDERGKRTWHFRYKEGAIEKAKARPLRDLGPMPEPKPDHESEPEPIIDFDLRRLLTLFERSVVAQEQLARHFLGSAVKPAASNPTIKFRRHA